MSFVQGNVKSYYSANALSANVLVKKVDGGVVALDTPATDVAIGVTIAPAAADTAVTVRLLNGGGTAEILVSGAISDGAPVYQAADGTIDGVTVANPVIGYAEDSATAAGDVIEVLLK